MTMAWAIKKRQSTKQTKQHHYEIKRHLLTPFKQNLAYSFTKAQTRVINEIFADMQKDLPMTRLIQGDVGSGKTVVALCSMLLAVENGFQCAFMAPTEILATQHFITLKRYLKDLPVNIKLLTSKTSKKEKDTVLKDLKEGKINIIIGTHSLIEDKVQFKNLKLIVIDEQHRFGVKQRAKLRAKAKHIDMLSMTATPIPRTFALAFYGDLDVSTIDQMPPGRQPVKTEHLSEHNAFKILQSEVKQGRQAYIVYPLIDESDKLELKAATQEFERIQKIFPQFKTAMIHGAMKSTEKQKIMEDFLNKKTDILESGCVIPAIEFDCWYKGVLVHLLGYGIDVNNEDLLKYCAKTKQETEADVVRLLNRRHPRQIIDAIHKAGGIVVLAHPACYWAINLQHFVKSLVSLGLDGLEVYYPYRRHRGIIKFHKASTVERIAQCFGLIMTGGSDSHGEIESII